MVSREVSREVQSALGHVLTTTVVADWWLRPCRRLQLLKTLASACLIQPACRFFSLALTLTLTVSLILSSAP